MLSDGLGNQLFQYATGRAVSLRLGVPLILDIRLIDVRGFRPLAVQHFNLSAKFLGRPTRPDWISHVFNNRMRLSDLGYEGEFVKSFHSTFEPRILSAGPGSLFAGYWQNEDYFRDIESHLRQELTFRNGSPPEAARWFSKIENKTSVSVHVRRGDYLSSPNNRSKFAICPADYYWRAAMLIAERTASELEFFIFSDEPQWALENIKLPGKTHVIAHNGTLTAHEDMRLMAACKHNIIANSTFSWWGAWLNANPGKIMVAPKTWYLRSDMSNEFINSKAFTVIQNSLP